MLVENRERELSVIIDCDASTVAVFTRELAAVLQRELRFLAGPGGRQTARVVTARGSQVRVFCDGTSYEVRVLGDPALAQRIEDLALVHDIPWAMAA